MTPTPTARPTGRLRRGVLLMLGFLGLHQLYTAQLWLLGRVRDPGLAWSGVAIIEASMWVPWLLLLPLIAWNARKHRLDAGWRLRAVLRHLGGAALIVAAQMALMTSLRAGLEALLLTDGPARALGFLRGIRTFHVLAWLLGDLTWYAVFTTAVYWKDARDRIRDHQARELALRAEATRAQLEALRHRLEPHFLFNALNALSALIRTDPPQAEAMLDRLADLFRRVLRQPETGMVSLGEELELVRAYLEVEQYRFGSDLAWTLDVAPGLEAAPVPPLLLQPLVENALRHGLAPKGEPGTLWIRAVCQGGALCLEVEDNGVGSSAGPTAGHGIGLSATRARLATLYGEAARLETGARPGGGFRVGLWLPLES